MRTRTVVIAPDSFKGSASAADVARWIGEGWAERRPGDDIRRHPMADGGEGTMAALESAMPGVERHPVVVPGPTGQPVSTWWVGIPAPDGSVTGLVELAATSGLTLAAPAPLDAGTAGVGHAIRAALEAGVDEIAVAVGGSASTDGGAGLLIALGASIRDQDGRPIAPGARGLATAASLDLAGLMSPPPGGVRILADVTNPMLGERGAAAVFGPQKGASPADVVAMDRALAGFAGMVGVDPATPGAGAAGGAAYALLAWGGRMTSGAAFVAERSGLLDAMHRADVVVTGEGRFDEQSAHGKVVGFLMDAATSPLLLAAGGIAAPTERFAAAVALSELSGSVAAAIADPEPYLREAGRRLAAAFPA